MEISTLKSKLNNATKIINNSNNNIEINNIVENIITDITDGEYASIWIYNSLVLSRKRESGTINISMEKKEGLLYKCFATKEAGIYNYLTSEKGYIDTVDNPDSIKMKSKIMIPLILRGKFIGIATSYASIKKIKNFDTDDLELFKAIKPFIVDAIIKIQSNNSVDLIVDRRINRSNDSGLRRRKGDSIDNLELIEVARSDTMNPQEILDYTSNIVHDIRTPANGLLGFLEILEEQITDTRLKEYIGNAKSSALLINDLTTSILDSVSSKKGIDVSSLEVINTVKFFSEIAEVFSANMYKKDINYNIFIDPILPKEIKVDSTQLKRVVMNLVSNASKFTPEHGSIEFSVRYKVKEKKLHLFVKDNGIGIAKEKQEDIFEAFKQAENNTKELFGGTGLGLSISAAYVKEMGGKLSLDSEIDKGSTFYFDIPIVTNDETAQLKPIENENINISILLDKKNKFIANHIARYFIKIGVSLDKIKATVNFSDAKSKMTHLIVFENKLTSDILTYAKEHKIKLLIVEENFLSLKEDNFEKAILISQYSYFGEALYFFASPDRVPKILIVEDDKISRMLISSMLENEYCTIDTAENGEKGLSYLINALNDNTPYDIVYTDHNMPLLSGSEMLKKFATIEKSKSSKKITTVCISGDHSSKSILYDFDFFATKPFKKQEIISIFTDVSNRINA
ncbi:MAG: hybrid sensor histidine kinase/response regulator [Campylobacterota bacterium]|nr:hybrid sensor histidine kinase/response regulator [Campylobacterota bacterium]